MNTHAEKSPENKDRSVAEEVSQRRSGGDVASQFADSRPQVVAQTNLQKMANSGPQAKQLAAFHKAANSSPPVKQLEEFQELANDRPRSLPAVQLQADRTIQRKITIIDDQHTKPDPDHPGQSIPDPNPSLDWHIAFFDYIYPKVKNMVTPYGPENEIINNVLKKYDADNVTFASPAELLKALIKDLEKVLAGMADDAGGGKAGGQPQDLKQDVKSGKDEKELPNQKADQKDQKDQKEGLGNIQADNKQQERNNIQSLLTSAQWMKELTALGPDHYRKTQVGGYWENYAPKNEVAVPPRRISDIIATVGPQLLSDLAQAGQKAPDQRLKLYRTMDKPEAAAIIAWSQGGKAAAEGLMGSAVPIKELNKVLKNKDNPAAMPIVGHLGGREQSETYFERGRNVMLEFTLKPGAQLVLFDPKYMALARSGKEVTSMVAEYEKTRTGRIFPEATGSEGNLPGYLGMKSEKRGDFSLTMGESDATHLLFQLLIESVKEV